MVYRSDNSDIGELKCIWRQVFGDSQDLIDKFFQCVYDESYVYVWRENGKTVSASYMIPTMDGGMYLYALATLPDYRRRGIMKELIVRCIEEAKKLGAGYIFLIPSEEGLCAYYSQFGFDSVMPIRRTEFEQSFLWEEISLAEYNGITDNTEYPVRDETVKFGPQVKEFVMYEHISEGHKTVKIICDGAVAGAALMNVEDNLHIIHYSLKNETCINVVVSGNTQGTVMAAKLNGKVPDNIMGYIPF